MAVIIQGVKINMCVKLNRAYLFSLVAQFIPHLNAGYTQTNRLYPIYD